MDTCIEARNSDYDLARMVEYGEVRMKLNHRLELAHARWLRGAVIGVGSRVEFHNHVGREFVYQHPLIRYDTSEGDAAVVGLAHGALLVRSLPSLDSLHLGPDVLSITDRTVIADRVPIGPHPEMIDYEFRSPYLALNQENDQAWRRASGTQRARLLDRILVGNLLSLSKAIGLNVSVRLRAETFLTPSGFEEFKPGLRLLGFRGSFRVNFLLPQRWGIGKSSARGFGTLVHKES